MARLIVLQTASTARQINVGQWPYTVGRAPSCDLVLDNNQVSRLHATFRKSPDGFEVVDAESNNGTWINGHRVQRSALHNGDEVRVGGCVIRFLTDGGDIAPDEALRLVTVPGRLDELELQKLAPRR